MGFIESFFKKQPRDVKAEDVSSFISLKIEENMNLDYKDIKAYNDPDRLAINVASFANAYGGLIMLGVAEDTIKYQKGKTEKVFPEKITWGEVSLDKERLENQLTARIQPPISGLAVRPIRNEKRQVIFLIDIPKSNSAPHMSPDHVYHKRMNFRIDAMEHYEVANLFRTNWTMKQKLLESIYEPLASILENHAKQIREYHCPDGRDVEGILSKTYYKAQMPSELLDRIDLYMDHLEGLVRKEHFARESVIGISTRNITDYLRKKHGISGKPPVLLDYVSVNTSPRKYEFKLDSHLAYELLLSNQSIADYVSRVCWRDVYDEVSISYGAETYTVALRYFEKQVWSKCLKEASKNSKIDEMRIEAELLLEEVQNLIEEITRY